MLAAERKWSRAGLTVALACLLGGCGSGGSAATGDASPPGSADVAAGGEAGDAAGSTVSDASGGGGSEGGADAGPVDGAGAPVDAGATTSDGGLRCKRGIATNTAPSAAFAPTASLPGVSWWYNWSNAGLSGTTGIEFVPMIWGSGSLGAAIPAGARYLLGFNEPNFKAQADLTSQQAATDWPMLEAKAPRTPLVSPAVNFCGSSSNASGCTDPTVTDPYTYLKDFFADCSGCRVDYVAVHWYNCDLPSLKAYLEGNVDAGGTLQGFTQFGKPIWLTEFCCDNTHPVAEQMAYMQAAVPYLENNPNVLRYSWFSASAIPNALLMNSDGSLTSLGQTYAGLAETCSAGP